MIADDIVSAARQLIDTPFVHQGRLPGIGLDCAGLAIATATALGLPVADRTDYGRNPSGGLLEAALDAQPCLRRILSAPQPGDILLMRFAGDPQHLAILAGATMIHAWSTVGKVCEHDFDAAWQRRVVRVYRFIEVTP